MNQMLLFAMLICAVMTAPGSIVSSNKTEKSETSKQASSSTGMVH